MAGRGYPVVVNAGHGNGWEGISSNDGGGQCT